MVAPDLLDDHILAIDIGATEIKLGVIERSGQLIGTTQRIATPYPCTPARLIRTVIKEIERSGCSRIGIGFPGELVSGSVIEPGNLSRSGGINTDISPEIHEKWLNFDLEGGLRAVCPREIRVVNDATLAALGYCRGIGRELTFTLGTGFGISLVVDGAIVRIRDVGAEVFKDGETFDELLGERSRSRDGERWESLLLLAVEAFALEFGAETVHIGGGNARHVDVDLFRHSSYRVEVHSNDRTLRGAARLFP
jgi:polyphosphate glucokinase